MKTESTIHVIKSINESSEITIIRDSDLSNRQGYDPNFLGVLVPLPLPTSSILNSIAINNEPNRNGNKYLDYQHYSVMFNKAKKLPFVTAVNVDGETNELAMVHEERGSDSWFPDSRITVGTDNFQFSNHDYLGSGFQKGHMVRYYDPAWGDIETKKIAMGDTFYYTNCCPQLRNLNVGYWGQLEDYTMARAIFRDKRVSIFSGPIFNKAKRIQRLLVPINFWKIIVYKEDNHLHAMGFLVSQEIAYNKLIQEAFIVENLVQPRLTSGDINRLFNEKNLKKWQVKLSYLEEKTGLQFGLNEVDVNKNEDHYFGKPDEPQQEKRIMDFSSFEETIDVETFLKNV